MMPFFIPNLLAMNLQNIINPAAEINATPNNKPNNIDCSPIPNTYIPYKLAIVDNMPITYQYAKFVTMKLRNDLFFKENFRE